MEIIIKNYIVIVIVGMLDMFVVEEVVIIVEIFGN